MAGRATVSPLEFVVDYWVEVRATQVRHGRPWFVALPVAQFTSGGFRSVYAYTTETRDRIIAERSTAGLTREPVYSDTLFCDFDNCEPDALLQHLYDEGIGAKVYDSGGRSWHVHVPIEPMFGADVPWSQRVWMERVAPRADVTFYHQAGQYRLAGTRHEKTGGYKILVRELPGTRTLTIPVVARPAASQPSVGYGGTFFAHLLRPQLEGSRRVYVWHLAKLAHKEGVPFVVAVERILWWNKMFCRPELEQPVIEGKIRDVYFTRGRTKKTANPVA